MKFECTDTLRKANDFSRQNDSIVCRLPDYCITEYFDLYFIAYSSTLTVAVKYEIKYILLAN